VACVGHAALDHVFEVEQLSAPSSKTLARRYRPLAGGMSLHAAIAAARLGACVRLLGRVGDDGAADFLRQCLAAEGVEPRGLASVRGCTTSLASVIVDAQGERQIVVYRGDALRRGHPLDTRELEGADVVLVDPRWADGAATALAWARAHGVLSVLDGEVAPLADLDRLVPLATWVAFSAPGLALWARGRDTDAALSDVLALGPRGALVTQGAAGARYLERPGGVAQQVPAPRITALDTTGAGDVFHAALALGLCEGRRPRDAVAWACAAAAYKCVHGVGHAGTPTRAQLDHWIRAPSGVGAAAPVTRRRSGRAR
jgi:sulfofructose kinase